MSAPSDAVATFRKHWANRLIDTVTVTRTTARGTLNASTLVYDSGTDSTPYTGDALIRPFNAKGGTDQFGGEQLTGREYSVYLPDTAGDFEPEDLVTIDACLLDSHLVGETMRVLSQQHDSYLTRIELICRYEEGTGYA